VFGTEQRLPPDIKEKQVVPGPGAYQLPPKYQNPRFAMGIKIEEPNPFKKEKRPGPGEYETPLKATAQQSPAFSMGLKLTDSPVHYKESPGPGAYRAPTTIAEGPKYGFGTSQRGREKSSEAPGPGQYKIPSKIADLPAYAMPNQKEEFKFV
jgi:hypothetical protein